jgi:hypothetical protein
MSKRVLCNTLVLSILSASSLYSQTEEPYFYHNYPYGSQANYNPLSMIMNASYDILQLSNQNNKITTIDYRTGARNVWNNLRHAGDRISQYGWRDFIEDEVIPSHLSLRRAQYWPNYKLHLLGGGMTYVATAEWFEAHQVPYPTTLSMLTMVAYHGLNEVVENNGYVGPTVDPIADLLIFDPLGIVLFSIDGVPKFFSRTLKMADWSFQPIIDFRHQTLLNNGQTFSFKVPIPMIEKWRIFYIIGMEGVLGLTYQNTETDNISGGIGLSAKELYQIENTAGVRTQTTRLVWILGMYYDRNNSLLASLSIREIGSYRVRLNIYPGVFTYKNISLGFVGLLNQNYTVTFGVFARYFPFGIGTTSGG